MLPQVRFPEAEPEVGILVLVPCGRSALRQNQEPWRDAEQGRGRDRVKIWFGLTPGLARAHGKLWEDVWSPETCHFQGRGQTCMASCQAPAGDAPTTHPCPVWEKVPRYLRARRPLWALLPTRLLLGPASSPCSAPGCVCPGPAGWGWVGSSRTRRTRARPVPGEGRGPCHRDLTSQRST